MGTQALTAWCNKETPGAVAFNRTGQEFLEYMKEREQAKQKQLEQRWAQFKENDTNQQRVSRQITYPATSRRKSQPARGRKQEEKKKSDVVLKDQKERTAKSLKRGEKKHQKNHEYEMLQQALLIGESNSSDGEGQNQVLAQNMNLNNWKKHMTEKLKQKSQWHKNKQKIQQRQNSEQDLQRITLQAQNKPQKPKYILEDLIQELEHEKQIQIQNMRKRPSYDIKDLKKSAEKQFEQDEKAGSEAIKPEIEETDMEFKQSSQDNGDDSFIRSFFGYLQDKSENQEMAKRIELSDTMKKESFQLDQDIMNDNFTFQLSNIQISTPKSTRNAPMISYPSEKSIGVSPSLMEMEDNSQITYSNIKDKSLKDQNERTKKQNQASMALVDQPVIETNATQTPTGQEPVYQLSMNSPNEQVQI